MGTARRENHTASLGFSRADGGVPDAAGDAALLRGQRPYLRSNRFQGHDRLQRKDNSPPGPPSTSPSSIASPRSSPKAPSPRAGRGILTPSPFGDRETLGPRLASKRFSPVPQVRLTHVQLLFAWNPSPLQSSRFSLEYLLLPPRSAPSEAPVALARGPSTPPTRPSYSSRPNSRLRSAATAGCRLDA